MIPLYLSPEFLAAMNASGRTKREIADAVAPATGFAPSTVQGVLSNLRVSHTDGVNPIIEAVCATIGFPYAKALTATKPEPSPTLRPGGLSIDERFERARAAIRAQKWRLSPEDCTARRGSSLPTRKDPFKEAA